MADVREIHTAECNDCGEPTPLLELRLVYSPEDGFGQEVVCPSCFDLRLDGRELSAETP